MVGVPIHMSLVDPSSVLSTMIDICESRSTVKLMIALNHHKMEPGTLEAKVAATLLGFKGGSHPMTSTKHIVLFDAHIGMHRFRLIRWFMFDRFYRWQIHQSSLLC